MSIQTISTKELREDFSQLKSAMERGQTLVLLYRSKPLAEIRPAIQVKKGFRSFKQQQLKKWIKDDQLSVQEQKQIDEIINNLP